MGIPSEELFTSRMRELTALPGAQADDAFGQQLHIRFLGCDTQRNTYNFSARTERWMQNIEGVVHGGFCATMADHVMGMVAYCVKDGEKIAPTIQLQISYHRPVPPEETLLLRVRLISATARLIHLSVECARMAQPDNTCFSGTAIFYCKDK